MPRAYRPRERPPPRLTPIEAGVRPGGTRDATPAVCNQHHTLDQQLCRWLLMSVDRLHEDKLEITQEMIANLLGVRRESITQAAGRLQKEATRVSATRGRGKVMACSIFHRSSHPELSPS
ncbi:MAG: winged helix-turn-helix domain-containing protein [Comamonadaceae bacterium]|nr:winged helix-turn-helix domain-containing protein [Comamonadaceae bacterium]